MSARPHRSAPGLCLGILAPLLVFAAAAPAFADRGPPVTARLLGEPRAAVPGQLFAGELRIESGAPAEIAGLAFGGDGWHAVNIEAPDHFTLAKDSGLTIGFAALCDKGDERLTVSFLWNGRPVRKSFDLSEKAARGARDPARVTLVPGAQGEPAPPSGDRPRPQPKPAPAPAPKSGLDERADAGEQPGAAGAASRSIRVRGRFVYSRPDGVDIGVDGMTVRIYDSDPGLDDHLTDTVTGWDGRFDVTFSFDDYWEDYPDIYLKFDAANSETDVEHPTWGYSYNWETGVHDDIASYLNVGTLRSEDESFDPALHILTDVVRTWRWCHGYGYDPSFVDVEWPDGDEGAFYTDWNEQIHISHEHDWTESTHTHEYGHHFLHNYAPTPDPDYCNGICDDSDTDCGHCVWCEEDSHIAWSEGFPDYLAYTIPCEYAWRYGIAASDTLDTQEIHWCSSYNYDQPTLTEGYVAAVLTDIHDGDSGDNHAEYPDYTDRLAMDAQEILACVNARNPTTVMAFLLGFKADNPSVAEPLWETSANCGYDVDEEDPAAPAGVYSTSHSTGIASPDPTVSMRWTRPADDASGVTAYSYSFRAGSPALPDAVSDVEGDTRCESAVLGPGTYYFCIRSRDWAGNWSPGYTSWGPIVIREPEPSNLTEYARAGWDYPLVVTTSNASTVGSTHVSATLPGGTAGTYWNASGQNDGESATSASIRGRVFVDEVLAATHDHGTIAGGATFYTNNRGPITVRGGRHTLHYMFDALEAVAETDETDNTCGHQFVWTPAQLAPGVISSQSSLEPSTAGWEHVTDGSTLWFNSRGLRFNNSGWWNAVVVWANDDTDNYDVRMHLVSTGAQNGFAANLASSARAAGCLDAVLVNRNCIATAAYDVGVVHHGEDADLGFKALHVENDYAGFDDPVTTTLGTDHWLELYEFEVFAQHVGYVSVVVQTSPPTPNVHAQWRAEDFVTGRLSDCDAEAVTGADGTVILQFDVPETGMNSVCLFRDPKDGAAGVDVTFSIRRTPVDMAPYLAAGWHSPLTPRPANDGTPASVALPDTLHGNASSTYHNLAVTNLSPAAADDTVDVYVRLDGASHAGLHYLNFPGGGVSRYNYSFPYTVRGGRHTLSLNIDPYYRIPELDKRNNVYGEQYCWSPYPLGQGLAVARVAPPDMTGGWSYVTSGEPRWYNCDGLRAGSLTGWWAALAVMPGDTSNVDVRLHATLTGAKDGFGTNLAYSSWGKGCSDYVMVNFNLVARRSYDAGVLLVVGAQPYTANCVRETYLGAHPAGTYGPFSLGGNAILRLHEMALAPGVCAFRLDNAQGNVNWGLSLHPADQPYLKKSQVVAEGSAWLHGPGQSECFTVEVPVEGYYCLAVWKVGASDLAQSGQYTLRIEPGLTGLPDEGAAPARTCLAGAYPNPFNPQTEIAFDLATASPVRLAVYDLGGALVRRLVDEARPAGRHRALWDGHDESGRQVASGTYVARLVAGPVREARKLVLVK